MTPGSSHELLPPLPPSPPMSGAPPPAPAAAAVTGADTVSATTTAAAAGAGSSTAASSLHLSSFSSSGISATAHAATASSFGPPLRFAGRVVHSPSALIDASHRLALRREIVHFLAAEPRPRSALSRAAANVYERAKKVDETALSAVLADVAEYRPSTGMNSGVYVLKERVLVTEFDAFFPHASKNILKATEGWKSKRSASLPSDVLSNIQLVLTRARPLAPSPPPAHPAYLPVRRLLHTRPLVHLVRTVLEGIVRGAPPGSSSGASSGPAGAQFAVMEATLPAAMHALTLALHTWPQQQQSAPQERRRTSLTLDHSSSPTSADLSTPFGALPPGSVAASTPGRSLGDAFAEMLVALVVHPAAAAAAPATAPKNATGVPTTAAAEATSCGGGGPVGPSASIAAQVEVGPAAPAAAADALTEVDDGPPPLAPLPSTTAPSPTQSGVPPLHVTTTLPGTSTALPTSAASGASTTHVQTSPSSATTAPVVKSIIDVMLRECKDVAHEGTFGNAVFGMSSTAAASTAAPAAAESTAPAVASEDGLPTSTSAPAVSASEGGQSLISLLYGLYRKGTNGGVAAEIVEGVAWCLSALRRLHPLTAAEVQRVLGHDLDRATAAAASAADSGRKAEMEARKKAAQSRAMAAFAKRQANALSQYGVAEEDGEAAAAAASSSTTAAAAAAASTAGAAAPFLDAMLEDFFAEETPVPTPLPKIIDGVAGRFTGLLGSVYPEHLLPQRDASALAPRATAISGASESRGACAPPLPLTYALESVVADAPTCIVCHQSRTSASSSSSSAAESGAGSEPMYHFAFGEASSSLHAASHTAHAVRTIRLDELLYRPPGGGSGSVKGGSVAAPPPAAAAAAANGSGAIPPADISAAPPPSLLNERFEILACMTKPPTPSQATVCAQSTNAGTHLSFCGHSAHYECWNSSVMQSRSALNDLKIDYATEYNCPMCRSVCNTVVPHETLHWPFASIVKGERVMRAIPGSAVAAVTAAEEHHKLLLAQLQQPEGALKLQSETVPAIERSGEVEVQGVAAPSGSGIQGEAASASSSSTASSSSEIESLSAPTSTGTSPTPLASAEEGLSAAAIAAAVASATTTPVPVSVDAAAAPSSSFPATVRFDCARESPAEAEASISARREFGVRSGLSIDLTAPPPPPDGAPSSTSAAGETPSAPAAAAVAPRSRKKRAPTPAECLLLARAGLGFLPLGRIEPSKQKPPRAIASDVEVAALKVATGESARRSGVIATAHRLMEINSDVVSGKTALVGTRSYAMTASPLSLLLATIGTLGYTLRAADAEYGADMNAGHSLEEGGLPGVARAGSAAAAAAAAVSGAAAEAPPSSASSSTSTSSPLPSDTTLAAVAARLKRHVGLGDAALLRRRPALSAFFGFCRHATLLAHPCLAPLYASDDPGQTTQITDSEAKAYALSLKSKPSAAAAATAATSTERGEPLPDDLPLLVPLVATAPAPAAGSEHNDDESGEHDESSDEFSHLDSADAADIDDIDDDNDADGDDDGAAEDDEDAYFEDEDEEGACVCIVSLYLCVRCISVYVFALRSNLLRFVPSEFHIYVHYRAL